MPWLPIACAESRQDANGNMTWRLKHGVAYEQVWDEENRLKEMTFAGKKTTLTYDGNGSLVKKDDGIGVTTYAGAANEVYQIPAGRDLAGDDFNDGNAERWSLTGGTWAVEKRAYSGLGNAISLWTPTFRTGKVWAKVQTQSLGAIARNGYLVFDNRDADNYRFAGLQDDSNQWVIGEKLAGTLYTRAAASETINTGQWYSLELVVSGSTASLKAAGVKKAGYTFGDGVQGGKVGLLVVNAHSHFDDVVVSCQVIDDFRDGDANGWSGSSPTWQVENLFYGEYSGQDGGGTQLSLWDQSMTSGRLGATVIAQNDSAPQYNGYLVFDYLDASNYKYAGMDGTNGQWVIREVISGTDTLRASAAGTIVKGTLYDVEVQVSGNLATLKVGGVVKTSYTFDGIQGGQVGLRMAQAHTHFKEVYLRAFSQVTKYYTFGGQRIAMRRDGVLFYLAGDHLGTTSVVLDAAGTKVDESRHYPYGTERWQQGATSGSEVALPVRRRSLGTPFSLCYTPPGKGCLRWHDRGTQSIPVRSFPWSLPAGTRPAPCSRGPFTRTPSTWLRFPTRRSAPISSGGSWPGSSTTPSSVARFTPRRRWRASPAGFPRDIPGSCPAGWCAAASTPPPSRWDGQPIAASTPTSAFRAASAASTPRSCTGTCGSSGSIRPARGGASEAGCWSPCCARPVRKGPHATSRPGPRATSAFTRSTAFAWRTKARCLWWECPSGR
jgi:hypothetical protein